MAGRVKVDHITLSDGEEATVEPRRVQVLLVLPEHGEILLDAADALRIGQALMEASIASIFTARREHA